MARSSSDASPAMKILLSWLNEYADFGDRRRRRSAAAMTSLGLAVDGVEHVGATVAGVVTARVVRTEAHPDAAKRASRLRRHRRRRRAPRVVRRVQHAGRRRRAARHDRHDDARRPDDRATRHPRHRLRRACCARRDELGLGDDHGGILILPPDTPARRAVRRRRSASQPDVLFDLDVTRNRPDCWGYVGVARDLAAQLGRRAARARRRSSTTPARSARRRRRDRRRRPLRALHVDRHVGRRRRPVGGVDAAPPHRGRDATDQQRRRRQQLRDARAQPAEPRLRPRHARRRPAAAGFRIRLAAAGRDDDDARRQSCSTFTADDLLDLRRRRPADRRRRRDGRARHRDHRRHDHGRARDRLVRAARRDADRRPARPALRGVGPVRARRRSVRDRHAPSPGSPSCCARRAPTWSCTPGVDRRAGRGAAAAPSGAPTCASAQVNRILGTALVADELPGAARSDRVHGVGRRRHAHASPCRRGDPTARPRSTSSRRSPATTATSGSARRCRSRSCTARLSADQHRRRQLREVLLGLGISEAMPNPFLAPDTLAKAGLDGAALTITNPLVAEESVLRTSLRPGLLHAIAFNESHRRTGVALFEIGHVYPPGDGELPDEYEALCVVLAGRAAPGGDGGVARDRRPRSASAPASTRAACRPVCTPTRSATLSLGQGPDRRGRRDRSGGARRGSTSASGSRCSSSTSTGCSPRRPKPALWKADQPDAVERPRPGVRVARRRAGGEARRAIRQGAGALLVDLDLFDVYRRRRRRRRAPQPRLPAAPPADAIATSPTPTSPARRAKRCVAAAAKLGAELRG